MSSKFGNSTRWLGLVAIAGGLSMATAYTATAADFGGDCCADLEERIAELEATTARKGNRKVSLEISGHVNEAVLWWDDGTESNVGQYTNDASRTRFRFKGKAKITDDLSAGYRLEVGVRGGNSKRFDQDNDNGPGGLDLRYSNWFISSKKLGMLTVGLDAGASQDVTEVNLSQTSGALKYSDPEDHAFGLITSINGVRTGQSWRRLIGGDGSGASWGDSNRYNMIKYTTPELAGFTASANWGEDDTWEVGATFEGEFSVFKVEAAIAYGENTDGDDSGTNPGVSCMETDASRFGASHDASCQYFGGSISVMHTPSGIYGNFAAGQLEDDYVKLADPLADDKGSFYAFEAGIENKWNALGKTTFFGQYYNSNGGYLDRGHTTPGGAGEDLRDSSLVSYGGGIVQKIDAADMQLYIVYKHTEGDVTTASGNFDLDDLETVVSGARIKF